MPKPCTRDIRKLLLLMLAVLCLRASATAQPGACSLKLDQLKDAPELFGFRLGMTFDQVKAISPLIKIGPADKFGVVKTTINPHYEPRSDKTVFADVRTISLDFLDGKLVSVWIGFEETFKWPTLDEFVPNLSKSLNVPVAWPPKRNGQQLTCDGFSLFASIIARGPSIRLTDDPAQDTIAERREQDAEAAEAEVTGDTRTRVYFPSDCAGKDDVPAPSKIIFKTKVEAETAGYKLAKECQ
jgi:hypothetical protein